MLLVFPVTYGCMLHILSITVSMLHANSMPEWVIILHVNNSVGHVTCKSLMVHLICFILCHVTCLINHITMLKSLSFSV